MQIVDKLWKTFPEMPLCVENDFLELTYLLTPIKNQLFIEELFHYPPNSQSLNSPSMWRKFVTGFSYFDGG